MKTVRLALGLAALTLLAGASHAQSTTSMQVLQARSWAASCSNCHGTNGVAVAGNEPLAGMAKDDIVKKMLDFKNGRKPATLMHQLSKGYSDEQIDAIAAYFAAQKK